jgi:4-carboxymuconolactone decarboxylase
MPRIPLFPLPDMTPEQQAVVDAIVKGPRGKLVGPLRAALHRPELADKWQQLGELLRYRTSLPPRLSELAILVTARHWDSQFEWYAHEPVAVAAGLARPVIDAIRRGAAPVFGNADEAVVYQFALQLLERHAAGDDCYHDAWQVLQTVGIVELTALIGYYSMVALTLNAHEIPLPSGTPPPLPPRGA